MQCAGGSALALHLDDLWNRSPDVFLADRRPRVGRLSHGRGRRNGIDGRDFADVVGHVRDCLIAIQGYFFSRGLALTGFVAEGRGLDGVDSTACLGLIRVLKRRSGISFFSCFHVCCPPDRAMCAVCYVVSKPLMFKISGDCPASCDRGTNHSVTGVTYRWSKGVVARSCGDPRPAIRPRIQRMQPLDSKDHKVWRGNEVRDAMMVRANIEPAPKG